MLKDVEFPITVPVESGSSTSTAEALHAKVRKLRLKTIEFTNRADIIVDFSRPLKVTLYTEYSLENCCCCLFIKLNCCAPRLISWNVQVRNGDHTQVVCFDPDCGKDAEELVREITEAQVKYESAVRDLKAFEDATHERA